MTNRRMNALLTAYKYGYYRLPRRITTEKLAELMTITRLTFEEHLRKAENKIMSAMAPYLKLLFYRKPSKSPTNDGPSRI